MSREFHWVNSSYMCFVLGNVKDERPVTGEPVADAIGALLTALAPLEYAVASEQASDSGHGRVVLACCENRKEIEAAMERLRREIKENSDVVEDVIRDLERKKK